ncbi:nucleotide sugar dehydrogenase [Halobellus rubicundus]|uniref:UDP-N-acetyl-D-mannosamine dehydrogenase n=1 Tax=Halobellus rubicundus TaxID=2996466 RepID=A0ABD5MJR0_9EURY
MQSAPHDLVDDARRDLLAGKRRIAVWGTGFIGFSSMANFANEGVKTLGYDIDENLVEQINDGQIPIDNLEYWLGFETEPLVKDGLLEATSDANSLFDDDISFHLLAIPTEKDGVPWDGALSDVVETIVGNYDRNREDPVLVVIESTLTPGMTDNIVVPIVEESALEFGEDICIGVAPRRDWFISPDKNLRTLPRVFGGQDDATTDLMEEVLGVVCNNLVPAKDYKHAELVKSIENAYRHVGITLANQLSRAYPHLDMREVLRLVGTKWNIPTYFPSVGTGGYCIPLSSKYVLDGTDSPKELSILTETVETDYEQPNLVAEALASRGVESVAILGLSYKGDVKVDVLSPTHNITSELQRRDVDVGVNDPYFDDEYISEETGAEPIPFPEGLEGYEGVLIVADHRKYGYTPDDRITNVIRDCDIILDNLNIWSEIEFPTGTEYIYTGGEGWLGPAIDE